MSLGVVVSESSPPSAGRTGCAEEPAGRGAGRGADAAAADFAEVRPRLVGIARQVLGRAADAEDVVQEVWVRWQGTDRSAVRDHVAFLVTVTTRLALNAATSARARREIGVAGPLPGHDRGAVDPELRAERDEAVGDALQLLIERLSPVERGVYVLREAFDYPFREIAGTLAISEANARQLSRRARGHLGERRCGAVDPAERDGLLDAFLAAARAGDTARLLTRLAAAVVPRSGRAERLAAV